MITIEKVWFANGRIYICTDDNHVLSRPLEAFPTLKDATEKEKLNYKIDKFGDAIRWADIDEDIHISSFYEDAEPDNDNEIAAIFRRFPQLNVSEVARSIGIHKSLLSKYIYGVKKPSLQRKEEIKQALRTLGEQLSSI
jgi:hypothetical protein